MLRKPTRHHRLLPVRLLTFSPFARSIARVTTAYLAKQQMRDFTHYLAGDEFKEKLEKVDRQTESSEDEEFNGVVQADFAFFDPKPDDFHGVKTLLESYLDNKQWDLSGFVDLISGQTTVGTVVKLEDDEDNGIFSVITGLNLGRYKHSVGLLVSQRVLNLPPELLPHLYDPLFDEVSWATEDEPTEQLRNSFHFKFYLLVSKIYKHKSANQKRSSSTDKDEAIIYIKPEDEIFHKVAAQEVSRTQLQTYYH
ncbi:hypothetical protein REPUB_Repub15cG0078700 [Reevesia pubescens]